MFSDDFWSEPDPPRKGRTQVTLSGFFKRIAASVQTIFAAKHAPDYPHDDALGDHVTLPETLTKSGRRADDTSI